MDRRKLIEAALRATEDERLADADALVAEAMRQPQPNRTSDPLELATERSATAFSR